MVLKKRHGTSGRGGRFGRACFGARGSPPGSSAALLASIRVVHVGDVIGQGRIRKHTGTQPTATDRLDARCFGPQFASGLGGNRDTCWAREGGFASGWRSNRAAILRQPASPSHSGDPGLIHSIRSVFRLKRIYVIWNQA